MDLCIQDQILSEVIVALNNKLIVIEAMYGRGLLLLT